MLEFEHIVLINDPQDKSTADLSRSELWQGLLLRARNPEKFNPALKCQIRPAATNEFLRTIMVDNTQFLEHVVLYPEERIHTSTVPDMNQIVAESEASIEEPQAGSLNVRFRYRREVAEEDPQVDTAEYLKSAYVQMDLEAVSIIRQLAEREMFKH